MHAVISRDSLAAIRHHLAKSLDIGTARLSECLASGLGFPTNAALLAHLDASDPGVVDVAEVDPAAFQERLGRFGFPDTPGAAACAELLRRSLVATRCEITNDFIEREDDGDPLYDLHDIMATEDGWKSVAPHDLVAYFNFFFTWRHTAGDFVAYVGEGAQPDDIPARVLSVWRSRRDFDRPIADFIVDWVQDAMHGRTDDDDGSAWGEMIAAAYEDRIRAFLVATAATWRPEEGAPPPGDIEPVERPFKVVTVVEGNRLEGDIVGLEAHGRDRERLTISGALAMVAYRSGIPKAEIHGLVLTIRKAYQAPVSIVRAIAEDIRRQLPGAGLLIERFKLRMPADMNDALCQSDVIHVPAPDSALSERLQTLGRMLTIVAPSEMSSDEDVSEFFRQLRNAIRCDLDFLQIDFRAGTVPQKVVDVLTDVILVGLPVVAIGANPQTQAALDAVLAEASLSNVLRFDDGFSDSDTPPRHGAPPGT